MWDWIYTNVEFLSGLFVGFCFVLLIFIGATLYMWKHDHTDMRVCGEDEDSQELECLNCGGHTSVPKDATMIKYCPGCGRMVEKIIDIDSTWAEK